MRLWYRKNSNSTKSFIKKIYSGRVRFWGGDDEESASNIVTPTFQADPYYTSSQATLSPFFTAMLQGDMPDYYKAIGETGSDESKKMLALTNRDITTSVNENMTRRGMSRSGVSADVISKAIGDSSTKFNYADYERALTGKLNLLNTATTGLSNVRSAALNNQSQQNSFNLNAAQFDLNKLANTQAQEQSDENTWLSLLSSGVGAIGNIYGMNMLKDVLNPSSNVAQNNFASNLGSAKSGEFDKATEGSDFMDYVKIGASLLPMFL